MADWMRILWSALLVAGCKLSSAGGLVSGPHASSSESAPAPTAGDAKRFTMPDLTGLTKDAALDKLHALGLTGTFLADVDLCQDTQIPHLLVCEQSPDAGAEAAVESPVHVVLQRESPDSDRPGVAGAHYAMPDAIGLTIDQARAKLHAAGFSELDHFSLEIDDEGHCQPDVICREEPAPGTITTTADHKKLFLGQSPTFYADRGLFE